MANLIEKELKSFDCPEEVQQFFNLFKFKLLIKRAWFLDVFNNSNLDRWITDCKLTMLDFIILLRYILLCFIEIALLTTIVITLYLRLALLRSIFPAI